MTAKDEQQTLTEPVPAIRRIYVLTAAFAAVGFVWQLAEHGPKDAIAFLLGGLGSFGNLWLFDRLSRGIAPAAGHHKPWQASAFIGRYIVLIAIGYATVNALGVSPLAVLLGLLASTAAVIASSLFDLIRSLTGDRNE
jgi:ATP synthase I chain